MTRPPLAEYPARRIALIKPSALGDIVHALPTLTALRRRYPEAHITWVVNRAYEPLLLGHPGLDATLAFDRGAIRGGFWAGFMGFGGFLRRLRRERFDLVIDLQGLLRSGLMALASGAPRRVGLDSAREGATWCFTDVVPHADRKTVHAIDRYLLAARALGAETAPVSYQVPIDAASHDWASETLASLPRPWVMIGPGSRWQTKRWPPGHFAALANRVHGEAGGTTILVGGAEDSPLSRAVMEALDSRGVDLTGRTSLPRLAAILARADLMLANDTGPLHLAVALGRPVVAPYTCTSVRQTGPYRAVGGAVETTVHCQGSYLKRCSRMECMAELTPQRLWPLVREVLESWDSHSLSA